MPLGIKDGVSKYATFMSLIKIFLVSGIGNFLQNPLWKQIVTGKFIDENKSGDMEWGYGKPLDMNGRR